MTQHFNSCSYETCVPDCPSKQRKTAVRLISMDGKSTYLTGIENNTVNAIIFCNRVFLFFDAIAGVQHFRELKAERVRSIDTCNPVINPNPIEDTNGKDNHKP